MGAIGGAVSGTLSRWRGGNQFRPSSASAFTRLIIRVRTFPSLIRVNARISAIPSPLDTNSVTSGWRLGLAPPTLGSPGISSKEVGCGHPQRVCYLLKAACSYPIGAFLVLLHLLKCHPDSPARAACGIFIQTRRMRIRRPTWTSTGAGFPFVLSGFGLSNAFLHLSALRGPSPGCTAFR